MNKCCRDATFVGAEYKVGRRDGKFEGSERQR